MARNKEAEAAKAAGNEEEAVAEEKAPVTKKDPKPEGYVSPVEFAKLWSAHKAGQPATLEAYAELDESAQIRPQIIYGYVRNNTAFAEACVETNTDGRLMVNVNTGLEFLTKSSAAREAKKAAKVESDAAKAAEEAAAE